MRAMVVFIVGCAASLFATGSIADSREYFLQPGDVLSVSVWKEPDLQQTVLIRPDGRFSFPLAGEVDAQGRTVEQVRTEIAKGLATYLPDAVVTVAAAKLEGNKVYVIGKVNRPGEVALTGFVDVMQALSIAGGMSRFAALEEVFVLRRADGKQQAIPFNYVEVEKGRNLEQNIVLRSGDVVVVP